jgi:hypothetical protein
MLTSLKSLLDDPLLFFYIMRAIAIIMVLVASKSLFQTIRFLLRSTRTKGTLVRWEIVRSWDIRSDGREAPTGSGSQRPFYLPVVSFTAADGTEHHVKGDVMRTGKPKLPPGSPMTVRYVPAHPEDARVATIVNLWFFPFVSSAIAAFLSFICFR